ncbi:MAG TPA: biotin--[acetyl-CoA-carboxylase] ligase [Frankiaceae bacterium]|nr:biotin--[acetyl-CoA-carboxylase] ligase [Frankiaceae bacterium]
MSWSDLDRPPLSAARLARDLVDDGFELRVVPRTASTNADLVAAAAGGAPEGTVLVAESQEAGRGRLGRTWTSPPRAGLTVSVLLRPALTSGASAASGWIPLLTGLAVAMALRDRAGVEVALKWPNDVVLVAPDGAERKVAGILAEATRDGAVVVGIGLNVTTRADEFAGVVPGSMAPTSLALSGARSTDRETVLKAILRSLARAYASWRADPSSIAPLYRSVCSTLGRDVRVELPGGAAVEGTVLDVDDEGRLEVRDTAGEVHRFAAGDVVHLR